MRYAGYFAFGVTLQSLMHVGMSHSIPWGGVVLLPLTAAFVLGRWSAKRGEQA